VPEEPGSVVLSQVRIIPGMTHPSVGILGAGSMGEILAEGLLRAGWEPEKLILLVRREERAREAERRTGIRATLDPAEAVAGRDVLVVAVKPKDVGGLLTGIKDSVRPGQVVVSLAAGVPVAVFENVLPDVAVVRSMPNTPAAVDEAMTAYCGGTHAGSDDLALADMVLSAVGETIRLSEDLLDAVTAVSGTGPAYVFLLAEALTEAAIREGLPHHAAEKLVVQTLRGAGALLSVSDKSAFRLRAEVTSPGGTTAAAMHELEDGGFRALLERAVQAAAQRSRDLGDEALGRPVP
jgi:pyrroline-5-carboxylate reductase